MNGIRRKLRSQRGVTVVFALVIFLIMALFSYVMVNASLTAVQGAAVGQFDQQAYSSTRSVAFMIRDALKEYPDFKQTDAGWERRFSVSPTVAEQSDYRYKIAGYIENQLNASTPTPSVWQIGDNDKVKEKFGVVRVTMVPNLNDTPPGIIIKLEHWDNAESVSNYKMTVKINGKYITSDDSDTYFSFWDKTPGTDIEMTAQQGVS